MLVQDYEYQINRFSAEASLGYSAQIILFFFFKAASSQELKLGGNIPP
jgi:hypothetical protein